MQQQLLENLLFEELRDKHAYEPFHVPSLTEDRLKEIINDPFLWYESMRKTRKQFDGTRYILTFTRNPNSRKNLKQWYERILKELKRKTYKCNALAIEHPDSNIHCHAIIDSSKPISHTLFEVFKRDYGNIDLKRINIDNGVTDYIAKETDPITLEQFSHFIKNLEQL